MEPSLIQMARPDNCLSLIYINHWVSHNIVIGTGNVISYYCHASFISDKDITHSDYTLLETNPELFNMEETRWKCYMYSYILGMAKSRIVDEIFDEICIFNN